MTARRIEIHASRQGRYDGDPAKARRWRSTDADPPRVAVWEITLKCDLGCKHCGSRAGRARPGELSTGEALDLVDQLADIGIREVTLIGGEVYLRPDWDQIAARVGLRGMSCTLVTGGRAFDAECVRRAVDAGVIQIGVSIDGLQATHDMLRGVPGSWQAAWETADRIAASPMGLAVNTQINRLSMPELPALADLVVRHGALAWMMQLTVPMGRAADRPGLLLQPYQLLDLFPLLYWIKKTKLEPSRVALFPGNNIGYFGPYEQYLRYGGEKGYAWAGCGAGRSSLGIEADGRIKGCPSLPSEPYVGGSVRTTSLKDIHATAPQLTHIGERTKQDLWGFCRTCEHADRCKAGCTWMSHSLLGRPGNNPWCHHRAATLEAQGMRERVRLAEKAPGRPFDFGRYEIVTEPADSPESAEVDPVPLGWLARLFGVHPDARSMWPARTLSRVAEKYTEAC